MRPVTVAATQMSCEDSASANLNKAESLVRRAAAGGARVILLQELFETPYFCKDQDAALFALAASVDESIPVRRMRALARELKVVLPVSFFERAHNAHFNTMAMVDADGEVLGTYRKSHIPDGPGYQEKFYFTPGDTGFRVFKTACGTLGVGICWDQWFPEAARSMALQGAEMILYPTAIGSEPQDAMLDSRDHWMRVMQGHAGANLVPIVASNRIGTEQGKSCSITFYGSSFIAGPTGELMQVAGRDREEVIVASFDLDEVRTKRLGWGMFRDRRPDLYGALLTHDGDGGNAAVAGRDSGGQVCHPAVAVSV